MNIVRCSRHALGHKISAKQEDYIDCFKAATIELLSNLVWSFNQITEELMVPDCGHTLPG